jgi:outer membrane scaffolding protein for murein synthesis (MipA/OmpV family)
MRQLFNSAIIIGCLMAPAAGAADSPRWEIGLGLGGLSIPDYRGSDQQRGYIIPIPYFHYDGDILHIDREGAHGDVFASDRVKLDLSVSVGPPARSGKNEARRDMPDINPTFEAGPSLHVLLARNESRDRTWSLQLPLRAVAATDFSNFESIGWIFAPSLNFKADNLGGGWYVGVSGGPLYASEEYHDYFYEVKPVHATATRPAFDAKGGYSGSRLTITASRRYPRFWVGAFARYDNLSGAAFVDSPLVKDKESFMVGIGVAWILMESK